MRWETGLPSVLEIVDISPGSIGIYEQTADALMANAKAMAAALAKRVILTLETNPELSSADLVNLSKVTMDMAAASVVIDEKILAKLRAEAEEAKIGGYGEGGKTIEGEVGSSRYMTAIREIRGVSQEPGANAVTW